MFYVTFFSLYRLESRNHQRKCSYTKDPYHLNHKFTYNWHVKEKKPLIIFHYLRLTMKEKIIFWLGVDLTHFCLSWSLKKQIDADFYAIVDITNKPRQFFQNQKLVNFANTWFFFDHIKNSNKSVDMDYLINFEKKYNIDLWTLAINERMFYRFFTFHKFSRNEILSILESECKLFERVLDEVSPNYFITKIPSRHHHELFYRLCKARGIKILMLAQSRIGHRSIITESTKKFDSSEKYLDLELPGRSLEDLQNFLRSQNYLKTIKKYLSDTGNPLIENLRAGIQYLISENKEIDTQYYYSGKTKIKVVLSVIKWMISGKYRQMFIDKNLKKDISLSTPFVYFPMGVDMEETLLIGAPFHTNQTEIIRHVAKSVPIGFKIYVKENAGQVTRYWRRVSEYYDILNIPNVEFIHPSYDSVNLLNKCALVITINGSSGFEASVHGKPVIVFSDTFYSILPSVYHIKNITDLSNVIRTSLCNKIDYTIIDRFIKWLELNSINFDRFGFISRYNNFFYRGGRYFNIEIKESVMEEFLQKNESILEELAHEHVKKINWYKNQNYF